MKKVISLSTVLTYVLILAISCSKDKCVQHDLGHIYFTLTDLQICPYKGNEILVFKDSLGNTLTYKGIGRSSDYNRTDYENPSPEPDICKGDFFNTEANYVEFQGTSNYDIILINLTMDEGKPWHQNIKKYISININYDGYVGCFFLQASYFDSLRLYKYDTTKCILTFKDSLKIGLKKFNSVYILRQIEGYPAVENLQYVFYTIKEGVVGFRTERNGTTWYLDN
jgi:hypothetical protein